MDREEGWGGGGRCGRKIKVEQHGAQIKGLWVNERKDGAEIEETAA